MDTFGKRMAALRKERSMTQQRLYRQPSGLGQQTTRVRHKLRHSSGTKVPNHFGLSIAK